MQKIAGPYGTDYRIGQYVVIKEDEEYVEPYETRDGAEFRSNTTWGAVPADLYDERHGQVGLPDAVFEAPTLRAIRSRIENGENHA